MDVPKCVRRLSCSLPVLINHLWGFVDELIGLKKKKGKVKLPQRMSFG